MLFKTIVIFLTITQFNSVLSYPTTNRVNETAYIMGGWMTAGPYFWMAELRGSGGEHQCGGSIYNEYWIITAGHCAGSPYVAVGVHSRSKKASYTSVHKVSKSIRHPGYMRTSNAYGGVMTNDIALLKLATPIDFKGAGGKIKSIDMPTQGQSFGGELRALGWGSMGSGGYVDTLRAVNVPVVGDGSCAKSYGNNFVKETMFCAGVAGKDSCGGDSGGPLVQMNANSEILVGITSWGNGCGKSGYPGIYTRASSYVNWIKENAK